MGKRVASKVRSGSTHGTTKESTKVSTKEMTTREKGFESAVPSTAAFEVPLILVAKIPEGCSLSFVPYESNYSLKCQN